MISAQSTFRHRLLLKPSLLKNIPKITPFNKIATTKTHSHIMTYHLSRPFNLVPGNPSESVPRDRSILAQRLPLFHVLLLENRQRSIDFVPAIVNTHILVLVWIPSGNSSIEQLRK